MKSEDFMTRLRVLIEEERAAGHQRARLHQIDAISGAFNMLTRRKRRQKYWSEVW